MKLKSIIISTVCLSLPFLFTSCSQDNEGVIYQSEIDNIVSFQTEATSLSLDPGVSEILVPICRENASAARSITLNPFAKGPLTLTSPIVNFAEGEKVAYAKIAADLNLMAFGEDYKFGLKIAEGGSLTTFSLDSITVIVNRTLTWSPMEEQGIFESAFMEDTWYVDVLKADQTSFYILKECYDTGADIQIQVKGTSATVTAQKAWEHSTYGWVNVKGTGQVVDDLIELNLEHYVSAGTFGVHTEKFQIPAK